MSTNKEWCSVWPGVVTQVNATDVIQNSIPLGVDLNLSVGGSYPAVNNVPHTLTPHNLPMDNLAGDYSVVEEGQVPAAFRDNGPNTAMPPIPRHGGLYSGPESQNPWNSIRVTPTMTNYIQNNLRSANPPPGATEQYVGTPRLGNNYVPMPGIYWYNSPDMAGKYAIKATHNCDARSFEKDGLSTYYKNMV